MSASILAAYRGILGVIGAAPDNGYTPHGSLLAAQAWERVSQHDRTPCDACGRDRCDACCDARARLCEAMTAAEREVREARREFIAAVWAAPYGRQSDGSFVDECRADWEGGRARYVHLPAKDGWVVRVCDSRGQCDLALRTEEHARAEAAALRASRREASQRYEARRAEGIDAVRKGLPYETCEGQEGGRFRLVSWVTAEDSAWIGAPGVARGADVALDALHLGAANAPLERLAVGGETVGDAGETVHIGYEWITPARYVGASRYDALDEEAHREAQSRGVAVWVHRCSRDGASLGWRSRYEPRAEVDPTPHVEPVPESIEANIGPMIGEA